MEERFHRIELVRRFAGATTDAILDPSMQFFSLPEIDGFISYRSEEKVMIVFGDPTCAEGDKAPLAEAFDLFAQSLDKSVIYVAASPTFTRWAIRRVAIVSVEFGQELIVDPLNDHQSGEHAGLVRRKIKQAIQAGAAADEYQGYDPDLENAIEQVGAAWLKARRITSLHISPIRLFEDRFGKRWFYARCNEEVIGTLSLNYLDAEGGWLFNHLMVLSKSPPGTSELLVSSALNALKKEGCRAAILGIVPARRLGRIEGLGFFSRCLARLIFFLAKKIARLEGLGPFWGKFNPMGKPVFVLFSRSPRVNELLLLKRVLNNR